jgi:phosphoserine phosphatase
MAIKVVFFDCDGTLTKVTSSWEYLHRRLNLWDGRADAYQRLFREGKIDYGEFCRRDALLWENLPVSTVLEVVREIPYQEGAREVVNALKDQGIYTVLVSAGLSFLVSRVRDDLGIDFAASNELLANGGFLTGGIRIHVPHDGKRPFVEEKTAALGLTKAQACAVGDGPGDRGMFEAVGLPIGFLPHESILPSIRFAVPGPSLTPLLELIGSHG